MNSTRKTILLAATVLAAACSPILAEPITFTFTATNASPGDPNASVDFEYTSGNVVNGVFTPTGLIGSSFPLQGGSGFQFITDTQYGPSFDVSGTIEPITTEEFVIPEVHQAYFLEGDSETEYAGQNEIDDLSGYWTVSGLDTDVPDNVNSALLFAAALGALGIFCRVRHRQRVLQELR